MRLRFLAWALLVLVAASCRTALAVPPGLTIEFDGNGEGKVTFRGAQHTGPSMHCSNCHFELFDVSRSSQITRADHRRAQACFACHDNINATTGEGHPSFPANDDSTCASCHVPDSGSEFDTSIKGAHTTSRQQMRNGTPVLMVW